MPVRKIKAGYLNTTSLLPSQRLNRKVEAESYLERDFLFYLDKAPEVKWFEEQPLAIAYKDTSGKARTYSPDVLVEWMGNDGQSLFVLYEVKYRQDLRENWSKFRPKFKAAIQVCKDKGWRFKIMTEKEIKTPYFYNLEFLHHFSRGISPVESEMRQAIHFQLKKLKYATVEEVIAILFSDLENRMKAYPVLWRMIEDRTIVVDMSVPLTNSSEISLREEG